MPKAKKVKVTRWDCVCGKCGGVWQSRDETKPTMCRFCKSKHYEDGPATAKGSDK